MDGKEFQMTAVPPTFQPTKQSELVTNAKIQGCRIFLLVRIFNL